MTSIAAVKESPKLKIGDRIDIIKNKRMFSLVFPLSILIFLIVSFGAATGGEFFKGTVLKGIFDQALIIGTMATAVSFIYTTGNLDISVGSVMGLGAVAGALVYSSTGNIILMILAAMIVSILLMLFNCTLSVVLNIKTTMVAIVVMQLYSAIISEIVGADTLKVDFKICKMLENGGFRYGAFICYFILCLLVFHYTSVGRQLRFIGGNEKCAKQTGMNPKRAVYLSFLMAGIGVGIAAVFTIIRTGSVGNSTGNGMGMDVMLATVLGGMSIFGGAKSNTYSGIIGALTVSALNKGLLMLGVSSTVIQGVRGVVFLLLVFLNSERPSTLPSREQF